MTAAFRQLLNRHAMLAFERQLALMDLLGDDHDWKLSLREGAASFGPGRTYPVQLLGSRSDATNTWRWAWANDDAPVPPALLKAAKAVRQVGKKRMVPELIEQELPLDVLTELDGHTLALVATAAADLPAYYRFPYEGGALFAALEAPDVVLGEADPERVARVIREVISRMEIDHRIAFDTYVSTRGAKLSGDKSRVVARWPDGRELTATFDADARLVEVRPRSSDAAGEGPPAR